VASFCLLKEAKKALMSSSVEFLLSFFLILLLLVFELVFFFSFFFFFPSFKDVTVSVSVLVVGKFSLVAVMKLSVSVADVADARFGSVVFIILI
jgi:hypothetical protein